MFDKAGRGDKDNGSKKGARQASPTQQDIRLAAYFGDQQRVASDILPRAVGTSMALGAIQDLDRP